MHNVLVAYFSASGVTAKVAKELAKVAKADLYEIRPEVPYTSADLDWMDKKSRSTIEMQDPASRTAMADLDANVNAYDVIFVGFPIWWYTAPHIIHSFLEAYNFSGKTIILFATSGGSQFGRTLENLENSIKGSARIMEGKMLNGSPTEEELSNWIKSISEDV